jgi:hypothetical protein
MTGPQVKNMLFGSEELEPRQTEKRPRGEGRNKRPKSHFQLSLPEAAPPPPEIVRSNPIDATITRFTWRLVDDEKCVGYSIYRGAADNPDVAERVDYIGQPGNHRQGSLTWDDPFPSSINRFYWVASNNAAGTESPRVAAKTNLLTDAEAGDDTEFPPVDPPAVLVPPGLVLTDFTNQTLWTPFGDSRATATAVATTGVTVVTPGARNADMSVCCGIMPRFKVLTDLSGNLQFRVRIDNFVNPADWAPGDIGGIGMFVQGDVDYGFFFLLGGVGSTGNPIVWAGVVNSGLASGEQSVLHATASIGGTPTIVELRMRIAPDGDVYSADLWEYKIGAGSWTTLTTTAGNFPVGNNIARGLQLSFGIFTTSRNVGLAGRITEFELISGIAS